MEESNVRDSIRCHEYCALCNNHMISYINYSKYHGVCRDHQQMRRTRLTCIYCSSHVNYIIDEYLCCDFCLQSVPTCLQPCLHKLCENCLNDSKKCRKCMPKCLNCSNFFEGPGNMCSDCLNCINCKQYPKNHPNDYCTNCYNICTQCGVTRMIKQCPSCNQYHCSACLKHVCSICSERSCTKCFVSCWNECKAHYCCSKCNQPQSLKSCPLCEKKCCKCQKTCYRRDLSQFSCGHECCDKCRINTNEFCKLCPRFELTRCCSCGNVNQFINDVSKKFFHCFSCKTKICLECGSKRSNWSLGLHRCNYDHFTNTA